MESHVITHVAVTPLLRPALFVVVAVLAVTFLLAIAVLRRFDIRSMQEMADRLQPIDLAAFRLLTDSSEDDYLAKHLPPRANRQVRRARILAALAYLSTARANAMVLLRYAHASALSEDPYVAQIGAQLFSHAMRFQFVCFSARLRLYAAYLFPLTTLGFARVLSEYKDLKSTWSRMGRLQNPSLTSRISASL